jgi:hypothetical protein
MGLYRQGIAGKNGHLIRGGEAARYPFLVDWLAGFPFSQASGRQIASND